jgi:hypothetical protein
MRKRSRPSHATVVAYLALFLALGGTTYAATGGNFILGKSNLASTPTVLSSGAGQALKVSNTNGGTGVYASGGNRSKATAAVHGQSGAGNAVEGYSTANPASGVFGQDNNLNSYGVAGHSDNGIAVVGDSPNGWAMQALGNTTQTRTNGGFVKGMAYVDPIGHPSDPVQQCFNSQLSPNGASGPPGNCGISYSRLNTGAYNIGFGFRVDDRIASATAAYTGHIASAVPVGSPPTNVFRVVIVSQGQGPADAPFYILVY